MKAVREVLVLTRLQLLLHRSWLWIVAIINAAFPLGFVFGMGYIVPDISKTTATYITVGAAAQAIITVTLVGLPQLIAQSRTEGRLHYFLALPISREAYLLSMVCEAVIMALPGLVFALVLGWWHYDLDLAVDPAIVAVVVLAMFSMAGAGIALAILIPHLQMVNAMTQFFIFYFVFFSPVLLPADQLPDWLQWTARLLPPGYAADAMRATLTELPDTNLGQSMLAMLAFSVISLGVSAFAVRYRR